MAEARTANAFRWLNDYHVYMPNLTAPGVPGMFTEIDQVTVPGAVGNVYAFYYYCDCRGWVEELEFERRLRHRPESAEPIFAGWQNVEIFAVARHRRMMLYYLVQDW